MDTFARDSTKPVGQSDICLRFFRRVETRVILKRVEIDGAFVAVSCQFDEQFQDLHRVRRTEHQSVVPGAACIVEMDAKQA